MEITNILYVKIINLLYIHWNVVTKKIDLFNAYSYQFIYDMIIHIIYAISVDQSLYSGEFNNS